MEETWKDRVDSNGVPVGRRRRPENLRPTLHYANHPTTTVLSDVVSPYRGGAVKFGGSRPDEADEQTAGLLKLGRRPGRFRDLVKRELQ